MTNLIEIRSYNLKTGTREQFDKLFHEKALPMLQRAHIKVVSAGPSLHDGNSYYLVRAYTDLQDRQQREDAFYGSDEWNQGPREAILACIDSYVTIVISADMFNEKLDMISASDVTEEMEALRKLNDKFIENFIKQDTVAHNEIISDDFVCIENSGAIVGRKAYMKAWAHAYSDGKFTSFKIKDVEIRLFGNTALVRSTTIYTRQQKGRSITGNSVYTDTYVKKNGRWWCVQAQITPIKA